MEALEQNLRSFGITTPAVEVDAARVLINPLDLLRSHLANILAGIFGCDISAAYRSIQWPNNISNGDLDVVLPKLRPGVKAGETADELMRNFPKDDPFFPLPIPEGVHVRIFVNPEAVPRLLLPYILERGNEYGFGPRDKVDTACTDVGGKKVVVEFSSPNITSEFQGRHLRSTIIGGFISRLYESMGWEVTRVNYLGDWGKPIALLRVGWERYGSEEAYAADPVSHLLEVFNKIEEDFKPEKDASRKARDEAVKDGKDESEASAEIESKGIYAEHHEIFKKLEEGEEEIVEFWKRVRKVNIDNYTRFYEQLGVRFDEYSGESQANPDTMMEIEQLLKDKDISEESGGAWIVHMQKLGIRAGTAMIRDRHGCSTYLLRDLATVVERSKKYSFDKMLYVVASDSNTSHFVSILKILEALDMKELADKLQHVKFNESSKMSAILGKGYKPQASLEKVESAISSLAEDNAEKSAVLGNSAQIQKALATSALLVQELSSRSTAAHTFDPTALASFKNGCGVDLQYWLAKLHIILRDAPQDSALSEDDYLPLSEEEPYNLLRTLAQYPEVANATSHSLEATGVVSYLANVTDQLSDYLGENEDVTPGLAAVCDVTRIVLENGMKFLGLTPIRDVPQERADTPVAE
ncbi:Nucleotidylyl transferase [Pyrenochaeta sp. DS3sAY3a]|nr:Nucleotidylyl transferase [Pyrenochaeta sp. DS3sAY3a]